MFFFCILPSPLYLIKLLITLGQTDLGPFWSLLVWTFVILLQLSVEWFVSQLCYSSLCTPSWPIFLLPFLKVRQSMSWIWSVLFSFWFCTFTVYLCMSVCYLYYWFVLKLYASSILLYVSHTCFFQFSYQNLSVLILADQVHFLNCYIILFIFIIVINLYSFLIDL